MVTFDLTQTHFIEWQQLLYTYRWRLIHGCTVAVGCLVLIIGIAVLVNDTGSASISQVTAQGLPPEKIQVYISGAVHQAGVYSLESGQRLSDLVALAGGVSEVVDPQALNSQLNLATKLADGEHIHIPLLAEAAPQNSFSNEPTSSPVTEQSVAAATKISINSATATELTTLPQIGEKRAADIVAGRPYASATDLVTKEIVTEKMFAAIKDLIAL